MISEAEKVSTNPGPVQILLGKLWAKPNETLIADEVVNEYLRCAEDCGKVKSIGVALVFLLPFFWNWIAQAQEQQPSCFSQDTVLLLANERKAIEPGLSSFYTRLEPPDRGLTWRYTPFHSEDLLKACIRQVSSSALLIDDVLHKWVGRRDSGHWYRILSARQESGLLFWRDDIYATLPREPKRIRVAIEAGDSSGPVEMLRFLAPIRVTQFGVHDEASLGNHRYQFAFAMPSVKRLELYPTCHRRSVVTKGCNTTTTSFSLLTTMKYYPLVLDFMEDETYWKEAVVQP